MVAKNDYAEKVVVIEKTIRSGGKIIYIHIILYIYIYKYTHIHLVSLPGVISHLIVQESNLMTNLEPSKIFFW